MQQQCESLKQIESDYAEQSDTVEQIEAECLSAKAEVESKSAELEQTVQVLVGKWKEIWAVRKTCFC